jgi:hypothetical protein
VGQRGAAERADVEQVGQPGRDGPRGLSCLGRLGGLGGLARLGGPGAGGCLGRCCGLSGQQTQRAGEGADGLGWHDLPGDLAGVVTAEQGADRGDDGQLRLHRGEPVIARPQHQVDEAVGHALLPGAGVAGCVGCVGVLPQRVLHRA